MIDHKAKKKSATLWFNWVITNLIVAIGVVTFYIPEIGLSPENSMRILMVFGLITTFGNKWLRINKTKTALD